MPIQIPIRTRTLAQQASLSYHQLVKPLNHALFPYKFRRLTCTKESKIKPGARGKGGGNPVLHERGKSSPVISSDIVSLCSLLILKNADEK